MTAKPLPSVLATLGGRASAAPDADLLARFVAGDQPAFAELVRRYARLVWRVARTRCRSESAAEDVFQAAFVVLSRKAASIRSGAALAGWLHRTAHRLAVRAARKERPAVPLHADTPVSADPLDALTARELLSAVDDELAKLADAERAVLALCGIDGLTNDEAAKRLGTTAGSVKGRLERARAKLRLRLDARGLTLPAVALGLLGGPTAPAVQAALAIPFGGAIPPGVERLIAEGLGMSGTFTKATLLLALVGVLVAVGGGEPAANRATAAPVPKDGKDDGLIWTHNTKTGALTAYTPDGKKEKELTLQDGPHFLGLTPDGTKIAFAGKAGKLADPDTGGMTLHLRDITDKTDGTDTGLGYKPGDNFHWSPDGKKVARVRFIADKRVNALFHFHLAYDLTARKGEEIPPPDNHYLIGWAADGKTWLLHEYVRADLRNPNLPRYRVMSMPAGGGDVTPLCDAASLTTFEPADGTAFHAVGHAHKNPADDNEDATYRRWFRVSDGRADLVKQFDDFDSIDLRSSPDRKRVAVLGQTGRDEASDTVLLVYGSDGTNEQKLVTLKGDGPNTRLLGWFPKHADARKRNAPVPKKAEPEKLVVWSEPMNPRKGFATTHGIWTPDGKHVITGGQVPGAKGGEWPGELRVWNAETGKLIHTHHGEISYVTRPTTVAITPDGKTLAVVGYGNAQPRRFVLDLFDWGEEKPKASLKLNTPLTGVLLSDDGKAVFTLDMRGALSARDLKTEKLLWSTAIGGNELSWGLAFWNEGKELLAADEGGNVRRFDAATGQGLPPLGKFDIKALGLNVSKDEKRVAVGGYAGKGPVVIDCKDGLAGEFRSMKLPAGVQANQVCLSPDGQHLAVACSGKENALKVFDAATGDLLAEGKEHTGVVSAAQFSPDGTRLLTVGVDAIKVWNVSELMKPEAERGKTADTRRKNAPVPKGVKKDPTAWGEVQGGLQAGLRMPGGTTVAAGQSAEMQVVVRNVGQKAVAVKYDEQSTNHSLRGRRVESVITLEPLVMDEIRGPAPTLRATTLEPGEELVRWTVQIPDGTIAERENRTWVTAAPPPGRYQFEMKHIRGRIVAPLRGRPAFDRLGTGTLAVTLK